MPLSSSVHSLFAFQRELEHNQQSAESYSEQGRRRPHRYPGPQPWPQPAKQDRELLSDEVVADLPQAPGRVERADQALRREPGETEFHLASA